VVRRQADGRFDRLGKTLVTRIYTLYYEDTVQAQLYTLLMHKVGVSQATDGLDASAALTAAGVGEQDRFSDLAIANVIYAMIEGSYHAPKTGKAALTLGAVPAL
jgi:ribosomal protein L10